MLLKLGQVPTLVVSGADEAALVMKTNGLVFASRPASVTQKIFGCGGKGINFAPYGDHWRRMRKLCIRELLCPKQVRRMERIRVEEVGNLIHNIAASASTGATINFSHKMVELGNNVVFRAVFGAKCTSQEEFLRELDTAFVLLGGFFLVDLFPSSRLLRWLSHVERDMTQSCSRIHRIITNNIHERRVVRAAGEEACSTDDEVLVDVLLRLQQEDLLDFPLTTEIISAVLFDMFTGGTQTTGTVLEWTMSELVRNPEAMAKAQKEVREVIGRDRAVITNNDLAQLHYLRMVIKEVLRLHPPATLIPRMAREDCTIMSYDIPKNTNILINVFAISRDPRYWDNPDVFKPERFQNKNINYKGAYSEFTPFGAGRRKCPGIEFARSVIEIAVANLLYHFDWMCPDGSSESSVDMYEKFGITVNRRFSLQLKAITHNWLTPTRFM